MSCDKKKKFLLFICENVWFRLFAYIFNERWYKIEKKREKIAKYTKRRQKFYKLLHIHDGEDCLLWNILHGCCPNVQIIFSAIRGFFLCMTMKKDNQMLIISNLISQIKFPFLSNDIAHYFWLDYFSFSRGFLILITFFLVYDLMEIRLNRDKVSEIFNNLTSYMMWFTSLVICKIYATTL